MNRKRVAEEVIELLCAKLHRLPLPQDDPNFDYERQKLVPDVTDNHLDIAEVAMDLEDAFGFNFQGQLPGDDGLETIGDVIDMIHAFLEEEAKKAKAEAEARRAEKAAAEQAGGPPVETE